jgi:hemerythrin superfamily protein
MPTTTAKKTTKTAAFKRSRPSGPPDAIQLLTQDHREVKALFQEYQKLVDHDANDEEKEEVAQQICMMLTVHATVEEEIFYPVAEGAIKDPDLVEVANVEHTSAKDLIAQIEASEPAEKLYDATVKVLGEYIDHHVKEEEGQLFPQTRKAKIDLVALGKKIIARKAELMAEMEVTEKAPA